MRETWLILGGTSAIGIAFAHKAAREGCALLLAGREVAELERNAADLRLRHETPAQAMLFDARDLGGHRGFVRACAALVDGPLNVLLAFGSMPSQAECDAEPETARAMLESNLTGAASVLTALAPHARRVVVLGSVAAERGRPRNHLYGASKAGLRVFLQGYAARHAKRGLSVLHILAGPVDTSLTWALPRLPFTTSPQRFAARAWQLARHGSGEAHVPAIWAPVMAAIRAVPTPLFNRLDL